MSAYDSIASVVISNTTPTITFNNLPQSYSDLFINIRPINDTGLGDVRMIYNGDNGAGRYFWESGWSSSTAGTSFSRFTSTTYIGVNWYGQSSTTGVTNQQIYIPNYTNNNTIKHCYIQSSVVTNSAGGTDMIIGQWVRTDAITSISLYFGGSPSFVSNTSVDIYGVTAGTPKAEGGSLITNDGTYWYHAFLGSGTFTPRQALSADVLVVGGGGGGSLQYGGGGGAGGVAYQTGRSLSAQSYTVIVGAGGTANSGNQFPLTSGGNSTFDTITAFGGGRGGAWNSTGENGQNGGSGGGGSMGTSSNTSTIGGTATQVTVGSVTGYGNNGGGGQRAVSPGTNFVGGGGGGAGGAGGLGLSTGNGGAGGTGLNTWSSWLSALNLGVSGFIAGGGGGFTGIQGGGTAGGAGGSGGGGTGALGGVSATQATINTGSGGGGGYEGYGGGGGPATSGASGLVIVRYTI